jgi:hypothetical protein
MLESDAGTGIKPGIDCAQLFVQTRSFVYALITVFMSSIEARGC